MLDSLEWLSRRSTTDAQQMGMLWSMFLPGFMSIYGRYLSPEAKEMIERFGQRIVGWIERARPAPTRSPTATTGSTT